MEKTIKRKLENMKFKRGYTLCELFKFGISMDDINYLKMEGLLFQHSQNMFERI